MRTGRPHIVIKINAAYEPTKIGGSAGTVHVQDCINFLFPGLKTTGCEPIAKPIHFLDGPFTLKRINDESVAAEMMEMISSRLMRSCHYEENAPTSSI
jgi:hypothetical protein